MVQCPRSELVSDTIEQLLPEMDLVFIPCDGRVAFTYAYVEHINPVSPNYGNEPIMRGVVGREVQLRPFKNRHGRVTCMIGAYKNKLFIQMLR